MPIPYQEDQDRPTTWKDVMKRMWYGGDWTLRHDWKRGSRHRLKRMGLIYGYLGIAYAVILLLLVSYGANLMDYSLIVSLLVAEIPIAIVIWIFTGERKRSRSQRITDAFEIARIDTRLSHLSIHRSDSWDYASYPQLHYYVVNSKTKQAYFLPEYVYDLKVQRVIRSKRYHGYTSLLSYFQNQGIILNERYPEQDELNLL